MSRRLLVVAAALILAPVATARAQTAEHAAVRRAALDYIEGFYEGDTAKLARSVWKEVRKYGYWQNKPGEAFAGSAMPYDAIIKYGLDAKAGKHPVPPNAPKDVVIYEVQDQTASLRITAWWGTDYMLLAKEGGKWMITHVLWQGPLKKP